MLKLLHCLKQNQKKNPQVSFKVTLQLTKKLSPDLKKGQELSK